MSFKFIRRSLGLSAALFLIAALPSLFAGASPGSNLPDPTELKETEVASNQLLIKLKPSAKSKVKESTKSNTGISSVDELIKTKRAKGLIKIAKANKKSNNNAELQNWYQLELEGSEKKVSGNIDKSGRWNFKDLAGKNLNDIAQMLKTDSAIEIVEPNYVVSVLAVPNDPFYQSSGTWGQPYADLWGMKKINAETAWDEFTGSADIVVADIDTGVDRNHEDLQGNLWVNVNEVPSNGVDDDANGYIDDYHGWDWFNRDNDPVDDHGHGTHTVGTIAGKGNNELGVVGINWNSKVMALKFLGSSGSGYLSDGIAALQYAADNGARVSSNSWGCLCNSAAMDDAIKYEHDRGMVVVTAAGNNNTDAISFSPTSSERAVSVAASDANDLKAYFSNWGAKIDVAAPGVDILSTRASVNPMCSASVTVGTNYCRVSGTSMAAPHVAGLAALLLSKNPSLTNEQVRQMIRSGSADKGNLGKDNDFGSGRIDAAKTVSADNDHALTAFISSPRTRTKVGGMLEVRGSAGGPSFSSYKVEIGLGHNPTSWTVVSTSETPINEGVLANIDVTTLQENVSYTIRLTANNSSGQIYEFSIHDIVPDAIVSSVYVPYYLDDDNSTLVSGSARTIPAQNFERFMVEWARIPDDGSLERTWSASGIALSGNGLVPVESGQLAIWDTSDLAEGRYNLKLTTFTKSGSSDSSSIEVYKQVPDTTPPTVTITSPVSDGHVSKTTTLRVNVQDNNWVTNVEYFVDNKYVGSSPYYPYSLMFDTSTLSNGTHSLYARAYDSAGNLGISPMVNFIVDNVAPTAFIVNPVDGAYVKQSINVDVAVEDNYAATRVDLFIDGKFYTSDYSSPFQLYWYTPYIVDGPHTIAATVYDKAGNMGSSTAVTVIVDNALPTASLANPVSYTDVSGVVTAAVNAGDNYGIKQVEFYVDNVLAGTDTTAPYTYDWDTSKYAHSTYHNMRSRVYDFAGNQRQIDVYNLRVLDIKAPSISITGPFDGGTVQRNKTTTISAMASDVSGIAWVEFYVNNALVCSDPSVSYTCAWKVPPKRNAWYTITTKAYDTAGNAQSAQIRVLAN
jgi:subtilisin family serine protease